MPKDVPQGAKPRERSKENYDSPDCDEYGVNCRGVGCFSFLRACGLILFVFQSRLEMVEPFVLLKQPFLFFNEPLLFLFQMDLLLIEMLPFVKRLSAGVLLYASFGKVAPSSF